MNLVKSVTIVDSVIASKSGMGGLYVDPKMVLDTWEHQHCFYYPQSNGMVEHRKIDMGVAQRAILLEGDVEWYLTLPQIMRSICAMHSSREDTSNYLTLCRELRWPDQLVSDSLEPNHESRKQYTGHLSEATQVAYEKLRDRQMWLRTQNTQNPISSRS